MAKKRSSSKAWLKEHREDAYVRRAQKEGYRSRACYKLLELQEHDHLLRPGMTVLDLGAAPGGWSQVAAQLLGDRGRVIASDILPMDALAGVEFVQGDFTEAAVYLQLLEHLDRNRADVVLSDMAPNLSGMSAVDQPRAMYLAELALSLASEVLVEGGAFAAKVFQGEGFDAFLRDVRRDFGKVASRKPAASRARSREVYLVASGFRRAR